MVNLPDAVDHDLSLSAHVRERRRAARARGAAALAELLRPRHRRRHRLHRAAAHLLLQPARRRRARARAASRCPGYELVAARRAAARRSPTARSATCTCAATARSPTTGTSTRRPRPRSTATCSSPATATGSNENGDYVYEGRADDMIKIGGLWASPDRDRERARRAPARARGGRGRGRGRLHDAREGVRDLPAATPATRRWSAELQEWCKSAPAPLRVPALHRRSSTSCPKTPTGKIQRYKLRGMIFTALRSGGLRRRRDRAHRRVPARAGSRARRGADRVRARPTRTCSASAARRARSWPTRCCPACARWPPKGTRPTRSRSARTPTPEDLQHWIAQLRGGPRRGRRARSACGAKHVGKIQVVRAIVTGAARGIGKAVADRLAADATTCCASTRPVRGRVRRRRHQRRGPRADRRGRGRGRRARQQRRASRATRGS